MIKLSNVCKQYGSFAAVNNVSLDIPPGSIFAFLGINGAGKTTTIKMMAGILQPSSGTVNIGGFDIQAQSREAKQIMGYVPDRAYLYPKLTGKELLYFVCDLYRVPHSRVESRIEAVLNEYSLTPWQDALIESYSHGMRQRIAMCAAMVHEPQVLIVDEPMVGLDPHGAREFKASLRRYAKSGVTIFLSTHSLHVAEEIADYLAIIDRGSIITKGTLDEIRESVGFSNDGLEEMFLELTSRGGNHERFA